MDSLSPASDGPNWSKLPFDLLLLVFERLGFADFQRAKCVCSSWNSASRQSALHNQIPWMILFPEKGKDYCLLFNSKDKTYRIQDLGVNFANGHCLATCGSWFFMRDPRCNLYIMNIFTRERIDLPSVESQLSVVKIERNMDDTFLFTDQFGFVYHETDIKINSSSFWIDENTKDYVVTWLISTRVIVMAKNGDNFWKQATTFDTVYDMVYKDHKLYLYNFSRDVKVLDLSGDIPHQIFETQVNYDIFISKGMPLRVYPELGDVWNIMKDHLVVTLTGEILRVKSKVSTDSYFWSFRVYKLDSSNSKWKKLNLYQKKKKKNKKWEKLNSLGDEAILLDQGITVLANSIEGVNRNSIYFSGFHHEYRVWSEKDIFNFSFDTHKIERPHPSILSSIHSSSVARWFVPNFKLR
ncbi:probable F-box protein At4g22060 [Eutrema salsugineum]|uniref:probable F-box protein At4g22060 n=1 Tax=Eutrema salsugineum TaxID=72664 RepID=UPI000CECED74|nr:probable F-box protein At4g22060 [Eutrema salsugineum]